MDKTMEGFYGEERASKRVKHEDGYEGVFNKKRMAAPLEQVESERMMCEVAEKLESKKKLQIGGYKMYKKILGAGLYGEVHLGKHMESNKLVAIKRLRFENKGFHHADSEMAAYMRLKKPHPFIVHQLFSDVQRGWYYGVMEYIRGGTLEDRCKDVGRLEEEEARKYFRQLVEAVKHCHDHGVYHRDIKPDNLLLTRKGDLKLTDFGIAGFRTRFDGSIIPACQTKVGAVLYGAPEIRSGNKYQGAPADVWSCGVVLFVMLTGCKPFSDNISPSEWTKPLYPCHISNSAKKFISKMLDFNPETRITIPHMYRDPWFIHGLRA